MHRVDANREDGIAIVRGEGELDAYAAPDLTAAFGELSSSTRALVDFGAVSFLDSTVLGLLVRAVRECSERGCDVRVVMPRGRARRIFEITTLDRVLPVATSASEALGELGDGEIRPAGSERPGT